MGGGGFSFGRGPQVGCGGAIILLVLSLLTGRNFFVDSSVNTGVQPAGPGPGGQSAPVNETPEERQRLEFLSDVLDDCQNTWAGVFQQEGIQYQKTKLVVFRDLTDTSCGRGQAASGPFYCPADGKVYLDLGFMDELDRRFGAPGDFAQAYVIAHEIGHHVQNLVGTSGRVQEAMQSDRRNANEYSVRLELQADFYAGVWAHHAQKNWQILEEGDIDEALNAATAIGDDRLQQQSRGYVVPESFTHGSSEQRKRWFAKGFRTGDMEAGDTFSIPYSRL